MRILHAIHSLDLRSGGPSASLRLLAAAQVAAGHSVEIVCTDVQSAEPWSSPSLFRKSLMEEPVLDGIRLHILKGLGRTPPFSRFRYCPSTSICLEKIFDSPRHPDIVHVHGLFSHLTAITPRITRRWNIPYLTRPAGGLNPICYRHGNSIGKRMIYHALEKNNLLRAAYVQATSDRESEEIRRLLPGAHLAVIPHGTNLPPAEEREYARSVFYRKFPEFQGRPTVLFLSRLSPKKRLDLLIKAFATVRRTEPRLMLAIAGSNAGAREQAERLVAKLKLEDHVRFLGFLTGMLKEGAFASAAMLALPSRDENFGLVVVEAMAHGVPVLVSEGVDSHVYVKRARAGVVVQSTIDSIAEGIAEILGSDRDQLGSRGRALVEKHLTWPNVSARLAELYERAISGRAPVP